MATSELRKRIRALILGITGIIIALIFMRVVIDFLDPSANSGFAEIIVEITDLLISPMEGLIELSTASEIDQLNVTGLLSIFIYFITGLILAEVITAFIYDNVQDVVLNVVDGFFKIFEFIIFLRIVFDLLQVNQKVNLVDTIYSMTNWAEGAVVDLKLLDDRLDISMILILIFIVILDIVSEGLLKGMLSSGSANDFGGSSSHKSSHKIQNITHVHSAPQPSSNYANLLPQQPVARKPIRQNITVNVPAPAPVPTPQFQNTYNMSQPSRQTIPQARSVSMPQQDVEVQKPTPPKPQIVQPVRKIEPKPVPRIIKPEPVKSFEKEENPVKILEPKPVVTNAQPSFGQSYSVQSLPSRFRTSTMYGKTPKKKPASIGSRFKKLLGS